MHAKHDAGARPYCPDTLARHHGSCWRAGDLLPQFVFACTVDHPASPLSDIHLSERGTREKVKRLLDDIRGRAYRLPLGHVACCDFCKESLQAAPHNDTIEEEDEVLR